MAEPRTFIVRDGMDWGEFFVSEREPVADGARTRYAASWTCISSFGTYGHHWCSMGCPFAKFISDVRDDYLLGKIARMVFDDEKFKRWLNREIFTAHATREQKADASDSFRRLRMEYSGEALATMCYDDVAISHCRPEWCDSEARSHDPQAVGFVRKLWPKFVAAVQSAEGYASPRAVPPADTARPGPEVTR